MTDCKADSLTLHFNSIASQGIHITRPYFIKAKPVKKDVYEYRIFCVEMMKWKHRVPNGSYKYV